MRQPTWGFGVGCVDIPRAVPDGEFKKAVNGPDAEQADRLFQTAAGNATRTRRPIGPNQQFVTNRLSISDSDRRHDIWADA